jgi:hypothetical protein
MRKRKTAKDDVNEVELNADELLQFAPTAAPERSDSSPQPAAPTDLSIDAVDALVRREQELMDPSAQQRSWSTAARVVAFGVPLTALALVAGQYDFSSPQPAATAKPAVIAEAIVAEQAPPAAEPTEGSVLFTNPFDKSEVFEFPPGTTFEEARTGVAELLMQRAMERQHVLAARATRRR